MNTLVIGLDGGEWSIIDQLISEGRMPNTASLIDHGCRADLKTTMPPVSPLAWNSIYTGVNPGKHGIYDFSSFDEDYSRRSISSNDRQATPFWEILNDNGISTGLFKLPFTYPVSEVDGFFVSGFPAPKYGSESVYPTGLRETVGDPADLLENSNLITEGEFKQFRDNLHDIISHQTDILLSCLEDQDPEFVMTVYDGSDRIQHFFWKYMDSSHSRHTPSEFQDAIYQYYELFDQNLGRILKNASDNTNILLVSDHGFGPLETDIHIESWLSDSDYLTWGSESQRSTEERSTTGNIIWNIWEFLKQMGIAENVKSIIPDSVYKSGKRASTLKKTNYDWKKTEAFFSTTSGQSIYINLESKFRHGSVSADEYDSLVDRLVSELNSLSHPETGEKLLETVIRADEAYHGWAIDEAPDIIINAADRYAITGGAHQDLLSQSTQHEIDRSGDHTTSGIFIARGPAFKNNTPQSFNLKVTNIMPVLLSVNRCQMPNHLDGSIPQDVFSDEFLDSIEISNTNSYGKSESHKHEWDKNEASELEKNLKDLGYLD